MRRRRLILGAVFVASAIVLSFVPIYPSETMTRSFTMGGGGDKISYDIELHDLPGQIEGLKYAGGSSTPLVLLVCGVVACVLLAAAITLTVRRLAFGGAGRDASA